MPQVLVLDHAVRAWAVTHRVYPLDQVMWALSVVGGGGVLWMVMAIAMAAVRRLAWRDVGRVALALALAALVADYTLKPIVHRTRPFLAMPEIPVIGGRPSDSSFPSGHTALAFAGAVMLTQVLPAGRVAWWVLATAIACSRVYLGVHYPLDVLGGAVVGAASGVAVARLTRSPSTPPSHR
jgi:undecaprenyl-diphosphatase